MKKHYLIAMIFLLGMVGITNAQIKGTVLDEEGTPLPGASIVINGRYFSGFLYWIRDLAVNGQ